MNKLPLIISTGIGLSTGCIIGGYATVKYMKWFIPKYINSEEGQAYLEKEWKKLEKIIIQKFKEES